MRIVRRMAFAIAICCIVIATLCFVVFFAKVVMLMRAMPELDDGLDQLRQLQVWGWTFVILSGIGILVLFFLPGQRMYTPVKLPTKSGGANATDLEIDELG